MCLVIVGIEVLSCMLFNRHRGFILVYICGIYEGPQEFKFLASGKLSCSKVGFVRDATRPMQSTTRYAMQKFRRYTDGWLAYSETMLCDFIAPPHKTLWGDGLGECATRRTSGDPEWTGSPP